MHLCGKRFVDRTEQETEIKVYSNCDTVSLYVDGAMIGTQSGKTVFRFRVPLTGEHRIEARTCTSESRHCEPATDVAGVAIRPLDDVSDSMTVRKVNAPNKAYCFRKTEIVNWFDKEDYRPDCYSVRDTMGALSQNPQTAAILGKMMERMSASRGDVAKEASNNANLQKMMAGMTLESLIRQAGDAVPEAMIRQLNAALQRIKK